MLRCKETAEILFPGLVPVSVDDLRECDFGDFENKNYQELSGNPMYQKWIDSDGTIGFPGGETQGEFQTRCLKGFDEVLTLCAEQELESIALVVHGGTIMSIMEMYGIPSAGYFEWQVKNGEGYKVPYAAGSLVFLGVKELIVTEKIEVGKIDINMVVEMGTMFGECHAHIFANGYNYKKAVLTHQNVPDEQEIRKNLKAYQDAGNIRKRWGRSFGASLSPPPCAGIWNYLSYTGICYS